ncbi:glucose 1-dehydrogenase [Vulcanisaeta thermophila]|uniref:glucose 1-dehydrogenase n=1 Tax=Vulcanisaeta thermophila TaxID=867917 RepID=UPI0008534AC5|nr:glucose 1-dehydrogenase [Vulcanisaeta thermophila]
MKAVTVVPGVPESLRLRDVNRPSPGRGQVLLRPVEVGVCGTDKEIIEGKYGKAPEGSQYLILGHEALAEVAELGQGVDNVGVGDLVVPTVRRPLDCDLPVDFCPVGHYLEHGIWGLHGHAAEYSVTDAQYLVRVPKELADVAVLTEPLSVVEKGIDMAFRIGQARFDWKPRNALILGAGPVGLLATMVLRLMGLNTTTVATRPPESLKARLVRDIGGKYVDATIEQVTGEFDIVVEATGSWKVAMDSVRNLAPNGVYVLLGVYPSGGSMQGVGDLMTQLVLNNRVIVGSVNAGLKHFELTLEHMRQARSQFGDWLSKLITKRVTLDNYQEAYSWTHDDIKTVLEIRTS